MSVINKVMTLFEKVLKDDAYWLIDITYRHFINKDKEGDMNLPYFYSRKKCKEKYCIFRFPRYHYELFSVANNFLFKYEWAVKKGYIPIVDMEHYWCFKNYKLGENNVWEYVFEQTSVTEVLNKDWVLVNAIGRKEGYVEDICIDINGVADDDRIHIVKDNWKEYYAKVNRYIKRSWKFKKDFLDEFNREWGAVLLNNLEERGTILGVLLREEFSTDAARYMSSSGANRIYHRHPQTVGVTDIIQIVEDYVAKWHCSKIFVSTIYEESLKSFVDMFGDKVFWIERERKSLDAITKEYSRWNMNMEERYHYDQTLYTKEREKEQIVTYAKEIMGLAYCDYFIGAPSGGAIAALSINGGKYKDILILEDLNKASKY